jgi:predicted histidine transporter YuiF (NhaC family)
MTILRSMIAALVLATGLFLAPVATYADEDSATAKHPAIQQADAQREKEANRKRYLLVFPAAVIGITVALIIITRRRK